MDSVARLRQALDERMDKLNRTIAAQPEEFDTADIELQLALADVRTVLQALLKQF